MNLAANEYRQVIVEGTCGHRWVLRTSRPDERLGEKALICETCREFSSARTGGYVRVKAIGGGGRRCVDCGGALAVANVEWTCGPCDETRIAKQATKREAAWAEHLEVERLCVLELLPATLAGLRQRLSGTGLNALDAQRVIDGALKAGDVAVIGRIRDRPVWGLTRPLPSEPEPEPLPARERLRPMQAKHEDVLALLPATTTEVFEHFGFANRRSASNLMRRMEFAGLVRFEERTIPHGREYVWYPAE